MSNYWNSTAPFGDWFDDATWSNKVLPQAANLAGAAKLLGFAGVAFDQEQYPGKSGTAGTWVWNFAGNTHTESAVRAQVKARGAQLMTALVGAYPGIDIIAIHPLLPEGWSELVQQEINRAPNAYQSMVQINFWDGMTSVPGYGPIRFMDHTYNKTSHLSRPRGTPPSPTTSTGCRRCSAVDSRTGRTRPAASIGIRSRGSTPVRSSFSAARSPQEVAAQLAAFRKWGTGGRSPTSHTVAFNLPSTTRPYVPGMQAAATPGIVDTQPPSATVGTSARTGASVVFSGSATDNFAVRDVRWRTPSGASGAATMTWTVISGTYSTGYQWRMDWSAAVPASPGTQVTLTFEDVKGVQNTKVVTAP